jgi:hypothetical protein
LLTKGKRHRKGGGAHQQEENFVGLNPPNWPTEIGDMTSPPLSASHTNISNKYM